MIADLLKNAPWYHATGKKLAAALEYLAKTDFAKLTPGKYEIDGDRIYALVQEYESKPREKGRWEAHKKYIDVQYIVSGRELMGYAPTASLKLTDAYDETKDALFLAGEGSFVLAPAGMFFVLGPEDAHMPGIAAGAPAPVKKVVVKVAVG